MVSCTGPSLDSNGSMTEIFGRSVRRSFKVDKRSGVRAVVIASAGTVPDFGISWRAAAYLDTVARISTIADINGSM